MASPNPFLRAYLSEIAANVANDYHDNYDHYRLGLYHHRRNQAPKQWLNALLARLGYISARSLAYDLCSAMAQVDAGLDRFEALYATLADDESRAILTKVLAFRALSHHKVK